MGKDAAHMFVTLLIGMVLGAIIALQRVPDLTKRKPLAAALFDRLHLLVQAFRNIVFAQIKISLLNTFFTGIFLAVILPLFGIKLPLTKTLIVLTFLLGLLPVIGNLMSNTLITIVGLSLSIWVAVAALGYLIFIHKLEVLPQCAHCRRADQCQILGVAPGDAGVRGRVRPAWGGGRADLLRVSEERVEAGGDGLTAAE